MTLFGVPPKNDHFDTPPEMCTFCTPRGKPPKYTCWHVDMYDVHLNPWHVTSLGDVDPKKILQKYFLFNKILLHAKNISTTYVVAGWWQKIYKIKKIFYNFLNSSLMWRGIFISECTKIGRTKKNKNIVTSLRSMNLWASRKLAFRWNCNTIRNQSISGIFDILENLFS